MSAHGWYHTGEMCAVHSERANLHFIGCWSLMIPPPLGAVNGRIYLCCTSPSCVVQIGRRFCQPEFCALPATLWLPQLEPALVQECKGGDEPLVSCSVRELRLGGGGEGAVILQSWRRGVFRQRLDTHTLHYANRYPVSLFCPLRERRTWLFVVPLFIFFSYYPITSNSDMDSREIEEAREVWVEKWEDEEVEGVLRK